MRLFASDLRKTTGLRDLTVRLNVQAPDQREHIGALNDLGQALGGSTSIKTLSMTDARLEEVFVDALTRGLGSNTTLEKISLMGARSSDIRKPDLNSDRVVAAFIRVLKENTTLKEVNLFACNASQSSRISELKALAASKSMTFIGDD